jgi:hypothetical protein
MFRKTLIALIVVASSGFAASAFAGDYAAIAYSPSTGKYGYSYGFPCLDQAEAAARENAADCNAQVMVWTENEYLALAQNSDGSYGYGYSSSRYLAQSMAMRNCPGGHIVATVFA